jgi:hypothetical protein
MFASLIAICIFITMDAIYLSILSEKYMSMLSKIQNGKKPFVNWSFAVMSYLVLMIVMLFVVFPYATQLYTKSHSLLYSAFNAGFLIGFGIYGVYNTTVLSVFKDYSLLLASIDTIWGSIGFFVAAFTYLYLQRHVFFSS